MLSDLLFTRVGGYCLPKVNQIKKRQLNPKLNKNKQTNIQTNRPNVNDYQAKVETAMQYSLVCYINYGQLFCSYKLWKYPFQFMLTFSVILLLAVLTQYRPTCAVHERRCQQIVRV